MNHNLRKYFTLILTTAFLLTAAIPASLFQSDTALDQISLHEEEGEDREEQQEEKKEIEESDEWTYNLTAPGTARETHSFIKAMNEAARDLIDLTILFPPPELA